MPTLLETLQNNIQEYNGVPLEVDGAPTECEDDCCPDGSSSSSSSSSSGSSGGIDPTGGECACCNGGAEGETPSYWIVEISGVTDNNCDDCNSFNASFEVIQTPLGDDVCDYELDISGDTTCDMDIMQLNITCGEGRQILLSIAIDGSPSDVQFEISDFDEPDWDCQTSYSLTILGGTESECEWSGATVTITSSLA